MLAVREEQQLSFFNYTSRDEVESYLKEAYESLTYNMDGGDDLLNVSQIAGYMSDLFVHELYLRQLNTGDVNGFASREECIAAYDDDEKMDTIISDAHDVISYSGMFGTSNHYTSEFEQQLVDDVVLLLEELQLMHGAPVTEMTTVYFSDSYGSPCELRNSVLQEVW